MLKKSTTLILLTALAFNSMAYFGLFLLARHRARRKMYARVQRVRAEASDAGETEEVVEIVISAAHPPASFVRLNAHEIRYRGRMYDVVRVVRDGAVLRYYGLLDSAETAYVNRLAQALSPHGERLGEGLLPAFTFFMMFHLAVFPTRHRGPTSRPLGVFHPAKTLVPEVPYVEVADPPPWFV